MLEKLASKLTGDERTGVEVAIEACKAPAKQIAENAGKDGTATVVKILEQPSGVGYDAATDTFVDMMKAGIIDPLRVTRSALEAAFSVAGTALLTEAGVHKQEKEQAND